MSKQQMNFDDVLARTGNEQSAMTRGEQIVTERAEADAPDDFCAWCVTDTPLAFNNATDASTVNLLRDTVQAVQDRLIELDGKSVEEVRASDNELGFVDAWWIRDELTETYREAYFDACADPEACDVCAHPDEYGECGHEHHGDECPARVDA